MHADLASKMLSELVSTALVICAPILGATLFVGLLVSIVQVVTQIQEPSLAFIPKLLTATAVTIIFGSWMMRTLGRYWLSLWGNIPSMF